MKSSLFTLFLTIFIASFAYAAKPNLPPVIDAYVTLLDPAHLNSVRVNIAKSFDPDGKIVRSRMVLSAPGQIPIENQNDYIFTVANPSYVFPPIYQLTVTVWDNNNAQSSYVKNILLNSDLKVDDISGSSVLNLDSVQPNKKNTFSVSQSSADKEYKLTFTKRKETNVAQDFLIVLLNLLGVQTEINTFSGNVSLNDINIFAENELNFDTETAEKFIKLKAVNQLVGNWNSGAYSVDLEIHEVQFVPDAVPPLISSSLASNQVTNNPSANFEIEDDSRIFASISVNGNLGQSHSKSIGVRLTEGLNNFVVYAFDSFGNRSADFVLSNVRLDTVAPVLTSLSIPQGNIVYLQGAPAIMALTANFNEELSAIEVNGVLASLNSARTSATIDLEINQSGFKQLQIKATDIAGNILQTSTEFEVMVVNVPPQISLSVPDGLRIRSSEYSFDLSIDSPAPVTSSVRVNGSQQLISNSKDFEVTINLIEGNNQIKIVSTDAAGNISEREFSIFVDTIAPNLLSLAPIEGEVFYTNHFPISIPVSGAFDEFLSSAVLTNGVAIITGSNSVSGELQITQAGQYQIQLIVTDLVGNVREVTRNVVVDYSNTLPIVKFDDSIVEMLTNKISVPIFGTSNKSLAAVTLNGLPMQLGSDGKSFAGIFEAPANGRYQLQVVGTDRWGNVGFASTYIRVLAGLPDSLLNPQPPSLAYDGATQVYVPNFDSNFTEPQLGDTCAALDQIFENEIEFKDNLEELESRLETVSYTSSQFGINDLKVPKKEDLENFIGSVEEKLNYIKAPYLLMCKGINIIPDSDCPTNRSLFRLVMGEYPEPLIINTFPLPQSVKNFLIPRVNICTGFDSSDLTCKELVEFMPFVADLVLPSAGQVLGSPVGQFVAETLLCKDLCDRPEISSIPGACSEVQIPEIPQIAPFPTPIALPPRFGEGPEFGDWGGGSGGGGWPGGGGGCSWLDDCSDGNGDGPGNGNFICSMFPSLYGCDSDENTNDRIVIDMNPIDCGSLSSGTFGTIFNLFPSSSLSADLANYVAKCLTTPVIGYPKVNPPVITITAPINGQMATDPVQVVGFVNDIYAQVKVEGQIVPTFRSSLGAHFVLDIPLPADGKVNVEAVDIFGNEAVPVEIQLVSPDVGLIRATAISAGGNHTCAIIGGGEGIKCWDLATGSSMEQLSATTVKIIDLHGGIESIGVSANFTCAVKDGGVWCWGSNSAGELGFDPELLSSSSAPILNPSLTSGVKKVSTGLNHACALMISGGVKCWGLRNEGSLGDGSRSFGVSYLPVDVSGLVTEVKDIASGVAHSCAYLVNNTVRCWGNIAIATSFSAQLLNWSLTSISDLVGTYRSSCFIDNGEVRCSGFNQIGLFGAESPQYSYSPISISGIDFARQLSVSMVGAHRCAVQTDETVKCWGSNEYGQLGNGTKQESYQPVSVINLNEQIFEITSGQAHVCIIISDRGRVKCWGAGVAEPYDIQ